MKPFDEEAVGSHKVQCVGTGECHMSVVVADSDRFMTTYLNRLCSKKTFEVCTNAIVACFHYCNRKKMNEISVGRKGLL